MHGESLRKSNYKGRWNSAIPFPRDAALDFLHGGVIAVIDSSWVDARFGKSVLTFSYCPPLSHTRQDQSPQYNHDNNEAEESK
jgi:hypothetical protein